MGRSNLCKERYFRNYCVQQEVLSCGNGYENFLIENGWVEISESEFDSSFLQGKAQLVMESHLFLKELVEMEIESRVEFLKQFEKTFCLDGFSDSLGGGLAITKKLKAVFEMYAIKANYKYGEAYEQTIKTSYPFGNESKIIGECILEQFGVKYSVPIIEFNFYTNGVPGLDLKNIKEVNDGKIIW